VFGERHVRHLGHDPLERQAHREVPGVHDLVGATAVGEVDDRRRVVAGGERARGVVEVRPLQHELHGQLGPRFAPVPGDEHELREVEHHLVDQLDPLRLELEARTRNTGAHERGNTELDALRVHRVHLLVVDGDLGERAGREHPDRSDVVLVLRPLHLPERVHAVVGIDRDGGDEAVGVLAQGAVAARVDVVERHADHPACNAPTIHLGERHGHGVGSIPEILLRHLLEHVLRRELELLLRLAVLGLALDEVVGRVHVVVREADHRVDRADPGGHGHQAFLHRCVRRDENGILGHRPADPRPGPGAKTAI
jgi:hypothetical protein